MKTIQVRTDSLIWSRTSLVAQTVKRLPTMQEPRFNPWVRKILWRRKWQPTPVLLPGESHGWRTVVGYSPWSRKQSDMTERLHSLTHYMGRASMIAQLVKNLLAKPESQVRFLGWEDPLEKGKATHSSILAWRIPWTMQSTGLQRVGHD